jgi:epoxyqueuosine reductase
MTDSEKIKECAKKIGFDLVGICSAEKLPDSDIEYLSSWLEKGYNDQMEYMGKNFDKRVNPKLLLKDAKSIICVGLNYKLPDEKSNPFIADFAVYPDYHKVIKHKLFEIADFIKEEISADVKVKACVDSVPIAERSIAARAGLGFIGKNKMLINPQIGLQFLIGLLITNIELDHDEPIDNGCTDCNRCVRACPTNAFERDGMLNASKCISYLTIECKDEFDSQIKSKIANNVFGCDKCIKACPYTHITPIADKKDFKPIGKILGMSPKEILEMDSNTFEETFAGTTIERTGLENLKRNATNCVENT